MPDTAVLPAPVLPLTGSYALRRDRCVIELSLRFLRYPLLRGRFTATGGHFTLTDGDSEVSVVLDAASLRTGFPLLARILTGPAGLRADDHPDIPFTTEHLDLDADRSVDLTGSLDLAGTTRNLRLRGDLRHVDDERIVLWANGILPAPRREPAETGRLARLVARRRMHVEIAIEFVR